jgi:hypothetical protein
MVYTIIQFPRNFGITTTSIILLLTTSSVMIGEVPHANALAHSAHVAYVTDASCGAGGGGVEDNRSAGCSIFTNAITGKALIDGDNYTTLAGNAVRFKDVSVGTIDASGLGSLSGYDTVMLYQVCDIANHPNLVKALNTYLSNGLGKVVIYDGDDCSPNNNNETTPDYSKFLFPFKSNNPGPGHLGGNLTLVENEPSAALTRNVSIGASGAGDTLGDANTLTSNTGGWCAAVTGMNANGKAGIQVGYHSTPNGGLVIYDGQDSWLTDVNTLARQIFDNILDQPFNPDHLPCVVPVTGIKLNPLTATNPAGSSYTVVATVTNSAGNPQAGVTVTFAVRSGPNAGSIGTALTDASGQAKFTYTGTSRVGIDTLVATFTNSTGSTLTSNNVTNIGTLPIVHPSPSLIIHPTNDPYLPAKVAGAAGGTAIGALIALKQLGIIFPKPPTPSPSVHHLPKHPSPVNHSHQYYPDVRIEIEGGVDE